MMIAIIRRFLPVIIKPPKNVFIVLATSLYKKYSVCQAALRVDFL